MPRKRQSITFTDDAAELVEDLANKRGVTVSEVVRQALAREKWFDERPADEKILLQREGEAHPREVHFVVR
jgi:hypothetical protein